MSDSSSIADSLWWTSPLACSVPTVTNSRPFDICWSPPPRGSLKLNVDGSALGKPGPAGCGGVIRNIDSQVIGMFSGPLGSLDSNVAELLAIKHGLELFIKAGWKDSHSLIIESDSEVAVCWCRNESKRPWKLWSTFCEIDQLVQSISLVTFSKIFREANEFADALAKAGVSRKDFFIAWW